MKSPADIDELLARAPALTRQNPEQALTLATEALRLSEEAEYPKGIAKSHLIMGNALTNLSRVAEALANLDSCVKLCEKIGSADIELDALRAIGAANRAIGNYDNAIEYFAEYLDSAKARGLKREAAIALDELGAVSAELGKHSEALNYLMAAYSSIELFDSEEFSASLLKNIGRSFNALGNRTVAIEYFAEALDASKRLHDNILRAQVLAELGEIAQDSGDYVEATECFEEALAACDNSKNDAGKAQALTRLGKLSAVQGRWREAIAYCGLAVEIAEQSGAMPQLQLALKQRAEAYEAVEEFRSANQDLKRSGEIARAWSSEEMEKRVRAVRQRYEIEKTRRETERERERNQELKRKTTELENANNQLSMIATIGKRVAASKNLNEISRIVVEELSTQMTIDKFGIGLYNEDSGEIRFETFWVRGKLYPPHSVNIKWPLSIAARCLASGQMVYFRSKEELYANMPGRQNTIINSEEASSLLYLPLRSEGSIIGVFTAQSMRDNEYDAHQIEALSALASYIAIAAENSDLFSRMNDMNQVILGEKAELEKASRRIAYMANHDNLTDLPNRRLLYELLQYSFSIADRMRSQVAVMYIDLDDFKPVNDRFGHAAGDLALIAIANRLKRVLRSSDAVARVGGDEYIAFLTSIQSKTDVERAASKVIETCTEEIVIEEGRFRIGMSIGISLYPHDGCDTDDLIAKADDAMYSIKKSGKNGFAFYEDLGSGLEKRFE